MNRPRITGQLFLAVKDGIIVEQNLTEKEASQYRGTEIRTVAQRGVANLELYRSLEHTVKFRVRPRNYRRRAA